MTPESVRSKLWREAADKHVYVLLDGAQNESLLDVFFEHPDLEYECLLGGKLAPDMQEVAPYIVELHEDAPFTQWLLENGWAQHWGIFVVSQGDLGEVWRHLRQHTQVRSPDGVELFFRYYDPRVLAAFLPTCDAKQLAEVFGDGVVNLFLAEMEGGEGLHAYSLANGELVTEVVKAV